MDGVGLGNCIPGTPKKPETPISSPRLWLAGNITLVPDENKKEESWRSGVSILLLAFYLDSLD